jgi:7,8-dihydropterin-6-yl-methyl-4-(beta-D-ribofuranosyl)aminobenzene 5'-phosphate synthase
MLICQRNIMDRREVVCSGGAVMFSATVAALMGQARLAHAAVLAGSMMKQSFIGAAAIVAFAFAAGPLICSRC